MKENRMRNSVMVPAGRVAGRVSVVIPTRDNERTIGACVASARGQTGDVEVIVVDNHSSDHTVELARRAGADQVVPGGPERSAQRNRGLAISTGEIVVFVDSDMVMEPGVAESLRELFATYPHLGGAVLPETAFGEGYLAGCRALEKRMYLGAAGAEAARAFRASVLDRVGGYDEAITGFEDYELADRVRDAGWPIGRAGAGVRHDEGRVRLGPLWRKKRYYGTWWEPWAGNGNHHQHRRRLWRVPRPRLRSADVAYLPGLVLLKLVDLSGLAAGHLAARAAGAGDHAPSRPPRWTLTGAPARRRR
jgi:glycosyltransferase involved in cell wall biosynthesis